MQSPERVRLTACSSSGGCASKVGSADLARVLSRLPPVTDPNVLVGLATSDDAGVYRLSAELALVQTVDFFTPIVDDPYDFGRIAATNALSDVYAMGGTPITALNICAFPTDDLDHDILARILQGGADVCAAAGVALVGGHTVKDDEPKFGLAVTGTIHPDRVVTNAGARPGDTLLLTKPLGTGILSSALKRGAIDEAAIAPAVAEMTRLNDVARDVMLAHHAHAATDITGFGLTGHGGEMARASGVALEIDAHRVPRYEHVLALVAEGIIPSGSRNNRSEHAAFVQYADSVSEALRTLLSDATTSGGLLIAATPDDALAMLRELEGTHNVAIIGRVLGEPAGTIAIR